jgi:hypothetical protein
MLALPLPLSRCLLALHALTRCVRVRVCLQCGWTPLLRAAAAVRRSLFAFAASRMRTTPCIPALCLPALNRQH